MNILGLIVEKLFKPNSINQYGDLTIYEWYIPLGFTTWRHVLKEWYEKDN